MNTEHDFNKMSDRLSSMKKKSTIKIQTLWIPVGIGLVVAGILGFLTLKLLRPEIADPTNYPSFNKEAPDTAYNTKSTLVGNNSVYFVENPLTGVDQPEEEAAEWAYRRPLGVMVNNHYDARPQSGLIYADIVYEIVAEGGITRFLAFYLTNTPDKLGPIRSTREYYLTLVKETGDAMLMHHGYSPQALEAIEQWPVRSLQIGAAPYWRDNPRNVAIEHTLYADANALHLRGEELGWEGTHTIRVWKFKDDNPGSCSNETAACDWIEIDFWYEGDYSGIFKYNSANNSYLRYTGYDEEGSPLPHVDYETGEQVEVKNVIVQFVIEQAIVGDDKNRLEYELIGSGQGLVFMDGQVKDVTWSKASRDERTLFYDQDGNEVEFNRGKFWVSIVPERNSEQVTY